MPTMPIEIVNPNAARGPVRAAVFDFDGTVSLIREGWAGIMADLGLDLLRQQNLLREPEAQLRHTLEDQMLRLSGKPSIFQMRRLAQEITARGGTPDDPETYLAEFLRRLFLVADQRKADLAAGRVPPQAWAVPGTHALLDELRQRGVALYLASGTDLAYVRQEAQLLGLTPYFGEHIYAPADNTPDFSKRDVVRRIVATHGTLVGFGDGYSETVEVKAAGGRVVGVASVEPGLGGLNTLKRAMLIELGADVIVPDFTAREQLLQWLFATDSSHSP
jgi:phosphoglycolate phosphatase-like HAD superfamily hydrolase